MKVVYKVHSKLWDGAVCLRNHLFYRAALSHATLSTAQRALMMSEPDDWSEWGRLCCLKSGNEMQSQLTECHIPFKTDGLHKMQRASHHISWGSGFHTWYILSGPGLRTTKLRDTGIMPLACERSGSNRCCHFTAILKMTDTSSKIFAAQTVRIQWDFD